MNDEIKEIIDCLELAVDSESYKILLNYITNLQQEIEKLNDDKRGMLVQLYKANDNRDKVKQENYELNRMCELYGKSLYYAELTDYKSRCEKAIEYIKDNCSYEDDTKYCYDDLCSSDVNDLLNILQNGSE